MRPFLSLYRLDRVLSVLIVTFDGRVLLKTSCSVVVLWANMVEDNGPKIYSLSIVAMVLCWIFIGLRLFVRVGMKKSFAWDDAFAVLCLVGLAKPKHNASIHLDPFAHEKL